MIRVGSHIGPYAVTAAIGRGDPDGVFEVIGPGGRKFAMRCPLGDLEDNDPSVTSRFLPVAQALREFAHLNLVSLLDTFVDGGYLYLVTERCGGRTLQDAIDDASITPRKALVIARQILQGIAVGHSFNRWHRDLRPKRVLLVPMGGWDLVKVADMGIYPMIDEAVLAFGSGALTHTVPKPAAAYMAPEQVLGRSIDARTDLYAVGVMLYQMLAERLPFWDSDPELVRQQQVKGIVPPLDEICRGAAWLTPAVLQLVETALMKDRDHRFMDAAQMVLGLDAAFASLEHLPPD